MKNCKMCNTGIPDKKTYCSNACKFSDGELNAKRKRKNLEVNDARKLLKCNICAWESKDANNLSGAISRHLLIHKIEFVRESYKMNFAEIDAPSIKKIICPICNEWSTPDLENKSGWFTTHVLSHAITIGEFCKKYIEFQSCFTKQLNLAKKQDDLAEPMNSIECKICGKKFFKLSCSHLKKHGLTPSKYKLKYGIDSTASIRTCALQAEKANTPEIKNKMRASLIKTNQQRYGCNSYTQTMEGKAIIQRRTWENTYTKYINSPILNDHVKLLFSLDEYEGNVGKIYKFKCKKCDNEFDGKIENGRIPRCFDCYPKINKGYSLTELEIFQYINDELKINCIQRHKINKTEVDIYVPSKQIAIEFDGLYWHSEISGNKNKNYHLDKTNICDANGIYLIHIFEDEWIYSKQIVKSKLKHLLGIKSDTIYARKCQIGEVDTKLKNEFLNNYHLQGSDTASTHSFGLFYHGELVSLMTFCKYKYIRGLLNTYELSRFVIKSDISVVGGFSKLLQYFIKNANPSKIITFADKRWSNKNNVYIKNNFIFTGSTECSYWYLNNSGNRLHRFAYRKSKLKNKLSKFDANLTEWQNMQLNGYDRIWDCGSFKYELNNT